MFNKIEKFYNWLSDPAPILIDITAGVISILAIASLITLVGWTLCKIFGLYLIPVFIVALFGVVGTHLFITQKDYEGGIKQWWKDRPR